MLRIGLTGGIGAGKSVVAARFAALGAVIVDSDVLAREVVAPGTPGSTAVVAAFGAEILLPDGSLDRARLGALVFADSQARQRLNAIVHPLVGERAAQLLAETPADAVVVHDIPLLVENGLAPHHHLVVVVEAPLDSRVERLVRTRGMSASDVMARMAAQASDADRRAAADVLLLNDRDLAAVRADVDELWRRRLVPFARNLVDGRAAPLPTAPVAHRPQWELEFSRLASRLRAALGARVAAISHVGPTAVSGAAAPDAIGVRVELVDPAQLDAAVDALAGTGWIVVDRSGAETRAHHADPGRPAYLLAGHGA